MITELKFFANISCAVGNKIVNNININNEVSKQDSPFSCRCRLFLPLALGVRSELRMAWLIKNCFFLAGETRFAGELGRDEQRRSFRLKEKQKSDMFWFTKLFSKRVYSRVTATKFTLIWIYELKFTLNLSQCFSGF